MTYLPVPIHSGRPQPGARRHRAVAVALVIATAIVLVTAGVAAAAATSPRLSAPGWQTYQGFERVNARAAGIKPKPARKAHRRLKRLMARCSRLRGDTAPQSSGIRSTCKSELAVIDRVLTVAHCLRLSGNSPLAAVCIIGGLPGINRAFDANARAAAAVAGTLLPGPCQTAFAAQALRSGAAARNGRDLLDILPTGDAATVNQAIDAWSTAAQNASDFKLGTDSEGCGPPTSS
jgi:hypothetical protein